MPEKTVLYTRDENVGIIKLNRPKRLNAITVDLLRDFIEQIAVARQDESVTVVILTGAGRSFCAGEDYYFVQSGDDDWTKKLKPCGLPTGIPGEHFSIQRIFLLPRSGSCFSFARGLPRSIAGLPAKEKKKISLPAAP